MPYIPNTPESILPRSDSRNPATTCRGITLNGRPCRRGLNLSSLVANLGGTPTKPGKLDSCPSEMPVEVFYCWQHKDQVPKEHLWQQQHPPPIASATKKSSIESLIERLEGTELDGRGTTDKKDHSSKNAEIPISRVTPRNLRGNSISASVNTVPEKAKYRTFGCFGIMSMEEIRQEKRYSQRVKIAQRTSSSPLPLGVQSAMIRQPNTLQPVDLRNRSAPVTPDKRRPVASSPPSFQQSLTPQCHTPNRNPMPMASPLSGRSSASKVPSLSHSSPSSMVSQTSQLLAYIPPHLSPETTALLLTELSKPISEADDEGYIYVCRLTPSITSTISATPETPSPEMTPHLLPPTNPRDMQHQEYRHLSDAFLGTKKDNPMMKTFPTNGPKEINSDMKVFRLKIGRTNNIYRRLNQWTRQCSYDITLIRYYPSNTSSPSPSPSSSPTPRSARSRGLDTERDQEPSGKFMVPHVHRVERLIQIELADRRVKGQGRCSDCGKEHREWFEIKATMEELRLVDECVRRWVNWGMRRCSP